MSFYFYYRFIHDYEDLNQIIENIINDSVEGKIVTKFISHQELNANLNRLVKKFEKLVFKKEENELMIRILTNNITSPIIYIDRDGRIKYTNHQFLNSFDANIEINEIYETLRIQGIYKFIDDAFTFETYSEDLLHINERYYQAYAIPVNNNVNNHFSFMGVLFIFNDITELKKYENLQREFLADASHELKTPITAIKGATEILLNGENHTKETLRDFLDIIQNENQRMEKIVQDILLLSRLENDKRSLRMKELDLKQLINQVIEILEIRFLSKKQKLHVDIEENLLILGNYDKLKHVFLNLLTNSINYTDENKVISIKAYQNDNQVIVSIKDEGIGIDKKDLPHIFERFYRVDKARDRETGGTGLGLAIVKSTLDIHQAKIEVKSKLNEGSEFIIYFKRVIDTL